MATIATIGVYGFDLDSWLATLREAGIDEIWDVRQRRGVRGPEYAWANANRLQRALAEAGIGYEHHKELAPTTEMRQIQYAEDERRGVGKRSRTQIAEGFANRYKAEILEAADLAPLAERLDAGTRAALLCVERDPEACHRSLITARLAREYGVEVVDLRPA